MGGKIIESNLDSPNSEDKGRELIHLIHLFLFR